MSIELCQNLFCSSTSASSLTHNHELMVSKMHKERAEDCPIASRSWREWVHSHAKHTPSRIRAGALAVVLLVILWAQRPSPLQSLVHEGDLSLVQSTKCSTPTAVPTLAVATTPIELEEILEMPLPRNSSIEAQGDHDLFMQLRNQKESGKSTRMALITSSGKEEGGYVMSYVDVDTLFFGLMPPEPKGIHSGTRKLIGSLILILGAYLVSPYLLADTLSSEQQLSGPIISTSQKSRRQIAIQGLTNLSRSDPFSGATAAGAATASNTPSRVAPSKPTQSAPVAQRSTTNSLAPSEWQTMSDDQVVEKALESNLALYSLEKVLGDSTRAVHIRRAMVAKDPRTQNTASKLEKSGLPYANYDYDKVMGACCENVIGYLPLPLGVAGPININGCSLYLPMATTEGVLVASTNRGANATNACGGVTTALLGDGMTRGPALRFPSLQRAAEFKHWGDSPQGYGIIEEAFNSTSHFAKLQSVRIAVTGSDVLARFKATTGDAMGMNMISKGVDAALAAIARSGFDDMKVVSLSGNYCVDKKAAAINWVDGRGKSVCAQATITADVLRRVLKTDVDTLVDLNTSKNLVGSAVAGAMGGFNAHAANIVTAIFIATGQDPAQNVESSGCLTTMKK